MLCQNNFVSLYYLIFLPMAKYDNILDQDFYELFGKEVVEKAIALFPMHKPKAKENVEKFRKNDKWGKAVVLLYIMEDIYPNDIELKNTLNQKDVQNHLVWI